MFMVPRIDGCQFGALIRPVVPLWRRQGTSGFYVSQTDDSFFGFGQANKFDGISPKAYDIYIDNLIYGLLDAINFSLREDVRRSYTQGGAFLNNKKRFGFFGKRQLSSQTDPGNDGLRTQVVDQILADAEFTIGAAVITGESIDGV